MSFIEAVQSGLRNYVGFQGRARRSEFWWFVLFYVLATLVAAIIDSATHSAVAGVLVGLGLFLPNLALQIRRLHDIDRTGWWIFIGLIPLLGTILLVVWWCVDGTNGPNRCGDDPKSSIDPAVFGDSRSRGA